MVARNGRTASEEKFTYSCHSRIWFLFWRPCIWLYEGALTPHSASLSILAFETSKERRRHARLLFCTMPLIKLVSYIYSYLFISIPFCMYREYKTKKSTDGTCVRHGPKHEIHLAEYKGCPHPTAPLPQGFFFSFFRVARSAETAHLPKSHHHIEPYTGPNSTEGAMGLPYCNATTLALALAHKTDASARVRARKWLPCNRSSSQALAPPDNDERGNDENVVYNKHQRLSGSW